MERVSVFQILTFLKNSDVRSRIYLGVHAAHTRSREYRDKNKRSIHAWRAGLTIALALLLNGMKSVKVHDP